MFYAKQGYGLSDTKWFRLYIGFIFILTGCVQYLSCRPMFSRFTSSRLLTASSLWRMYLANVELQPWVRTIHATIPLLTIIIVDSSCKPSSTTPNGCLILFQNAWIEPVLVSANHHGSRNWR